jgi:esterase/lipase
MNLGLIILRMKNKLTCLFSPYIAARHARDLFFTPKIFPLKHWEIEMEEKGIRTDAGHGLSTISWGKSGRKILLVHGWESRATQLSGFVEYLVSAGFQVFAMDGPAHGHSVGAKANPYEFSKAVEYIYEKQGPFEGIIGHSMGGAAIAASLSEDVNPNRLVLISSPSSILNALKRFSKFIGLTSESSGIFINLVENEVGVPTSKLDTANNMRVQQVRGLIIHDKCDVEVPYKDALLINSSWEDSSLITTSGLGHRAIVRTPDIWKKVTDFMSST